MSAILTLSHIVKPSDARCQHWQRILTPEMVLGATNLDRLSGAGDLPGVYARKNSDHELAPWTIIIDGEANDHKKNRGWRHLVAIVHLTGDKGIDGIDIDWIEPKAGHKAAIKAGGSDNAHLMVGSGPNAACLRIAKYVLEGKTDEERLARLAEMVAV